MTKPEVTWVQSLDHCEMFKCYYFTESDYVTIVMSLGKREVDRFGTYCSYSKEDFFEIYGKKWRISLEPVPMPEVER